MSGNAKPIFVGFSASGLLGFAGQTVILSAAKNLRRLGSEIKRNAQDDRGKSQRAKGRKVLVR